MVITHILPNNKALKSFLMKRFEKVTGFRAPHYIVLSKNRDRDHKPGQGGKLLITQLVIGVFEF